jgi:Glycosyl transferase family 2
MVVFQAPTESKGDVLEIRPDWPNTAGSVLATSPSVTCSLHMEMSPAENRFAHAETCLRAGRLDEAIQGFSRILAVDPCHAASRRRLAWLARRLGRDDVAREIVPLNGEDPGELDADLPPLVSTAGPGRIARFAADPSRSPACDWMRVVTACQELARLVTSCRPIAEDITIAVPVFDTSVSYLHCCIDSIYRQTVRPKQVIIVDDHSSRPETLHYLAALRSGADLRVLRNARNLSLGPTMNVALRAAMTPFVLKLDSDDIARPALLERLNSHLHDHPRVDVLGCQMQFFGQKDLLTRHSGIVTKREAIWSSWFVNHTGILLNRKSVLAVGGYRSRRRLAEDHDLWVRMMLRGYNRFMNLPETLVDYRCTTNGLTASFSSFVRPQMILLKLLTRLAPDF